MKISKLSVIIPVYNGEKYIKRCLDSLKAQTMKKIEIIVVNDGSTDKTEDIIKEYINSGEERIVYLKKENGGLSDARNFGLKYATGDYYAFVDADDYINDTLFENLEVYMDENYDMVKFQIIEVDEAGNEISKNNSVNFENKTGEEAFNILFKQDNMTEVAWGYIYKAKFWKDNNFKYAKGKYHEDFGLTPLILLRAKKVASTNIIGYYYVHTGNSMVRDKNKKALIRANDLIYHYDFMMREVENYDITKESKENIKQYYTNAIILAVDHLDNKKEKKEYIKKIRKRKMIKNIKPKSLKQVIKKVILHFDIKLYLKLKRGLIRRG